MKVVLQRVNSASVEVNNKIVGEINKGLLVFLGVSKNYSEDKLDWMADKVLKMRLWASEKKGFDLSVKDIKGEILVISQFTLFGETNRGTKPNFAKAHDYDIAQKIYEKFISKLEESGLNIQSGEFGAKMSVKLENDGPVTLIIER